LSLYQTLVLLLFNNKDIVTYEEISESTKIGLIFKKLFILLKLNLVIYLYINKKKDENELKRQLQSLACGKVPILLKSSKGVEIHQDDVFTFNKDFTHKLCRIKINQVQLKETVSKF
jgi:cullin 4